jgi:TolA-binding protein
MYPPRLREYDDARSSWTRQSGGLVEQHDAQLRLMEDRVRYLEDRLVSMQLDLQHLSQSHQRQQNQLQHTSLSAGNQLAQPARPPSINLFDPATPAPPLPSDDPFSFFPSQASSSTLDIPSNNATGPTSIPTPATGAKEEDYVKVYKRRMDRNCFNKSIEKGSASLVFDESCFRGVPMDEFPDVIKRGYFTQNQIDLAFHL